MAVCCLGHSQQSNRIDSNLKDAAFILIVKALLSAQVVAGLEFNSSGGGG